MKNLRPYLFSLLGALVAVAPIAVAAPVSAAAVISVDKQNSLADGDVITVSLSGIPATQGVYVQQCYQPQIGLRAATGLKCNGTLMQTDLMLWATMDRARGSQSAAVPLPFTVRETVTVGGSSYPCGTWDCYMVVYRDHRGLSDTSLDAIIPLVFLAKQDIKLRSLGLAKDKSRVGVGRSLMLRNTDLSTEQGVDLRVKSSTPKVCAVSRSSASTTVRFVAKGECLLTLSAKGDAVFKPFTSTVTYTVN